MTHDTKEKLVEYLLGMTVAVLATRVYPLIPAPLNVALSILAGFGALAVLRLWRKLNVGTQNRIKQGAWVGGFAALWAGLVPYGSFDIKLYGPLAIPFWVVGLLTCGFSGGLLYLWVVRPFFQWITRE